MLNMVRCVISGMRITISYMTSNDRDLQINRKVTRIQEDQKYHLQDKGCLREEYAFLLGCSFSVLDLEDKRVLRRHGVLGDQC
jgi:hypothetical protein